MKQYNKEPLLSEVTGKTFCPKVHKRAPLVAGMISFFLPTAPALQELFITSFYWNNRFKLSDHQCSSSQLHRTDSKGVTDTHMKSITLHSLEDQAVRCKKQSIDSNRPETKATSIALWKAIYTGIFPTSCNYSNFRL